MSEQVLEPTTASDPHPEKRDFLRKYWNSLMAGDFATFETLVDERCTVHYPGNHFLSGDHHGKAAIVELYRSLYRIGIEPGTFVAELHDVVTSDDHACALITYRLDLGASQSLTGEAIGVFHIENGKMVEYWLLERDQKLINDIFKISGRATLAGGGSPRLALGGLRNPLPVLRTIRRVVRRRRGRNTKML
jgi:ketosteroid isomerase-like protein